MFIKQRKFSAKVLAFEYQISEFLLPDSCHFWGLF